MADEVLKTKIKKLAGLREQDQLLNYELQGYMKDSIRRKVFRESAKHNIKHKKKYAYVDQETCGKFLVQQTGEDVGAVFGIKAYGQKGRYVGHVDKVIKDYEKSNKELLKMVKERSLKRRKK